MTVLKQGLGFRQRERVRKKKDNDYAPKLLRGTFFPLYLAMAPYENLI